MKTLPLPKSVIKKIHSLIDENSRNLEVANPLRNILRDICDYDYQDAIKGLQYLEEDQPDLMDYQDAIKKIESAEKRYLAI